MINGLQKANKLSNEIQKFVHQNLNSSHEVETSPFVELILYYDMMSKASPDYTEVLDCNPQQIQEFLAKKYIKTNTPIRSFINKVILKILLAITHKNYKFPKNKTLFVLKNEKFYKYINSIIKNKKEDVILLTEEESLSEKARSEGFTSLSLQATAQYRFRYRLGHFVNFKINRARPAVLEQIIFRKILTDLAPKKVVLVEGNWHADKTVSIECKKLHIPSTCIQHGWNPNLNCQWQNLNFDLMLTWGKYFSEELKSVNQNMPLKLKECGSFTLPHPPNKESNLKSIGICLQYKNHIISNEIESKFLDSILNIKKQNTDLTFIIREHPSGPLDQNIKNSLLQHGFQFSNPYNENLNDFFNKIQISVSIYSSTVLESLAALVVPIMLNETTLEKYRPDIQKLGLGHETKSFNDVNNIIDSYRNPNHLKDKQLQIQNNLDQMFYSFGKESLQNYEEIIFNGEQYDH